MKKQHFICEVTDTLNPKFSPVNSRYFDGTYAQAVKFFKSKPDIKKYLKNDRYEVYFRANSVNLREA